MSNIYAYICDSNCFRTPSLALENELTDSLIEQCQHASLKDIWGTPSIVFDERRLPLPDLSCLDYRLPVLSARAAELLGDSLAVDLELLPLSYSNANDYFALNVLGPTLTLDVEGSDFRANKAGYIITCNRLAISNVSTAGLGFFLVTKYDQIMFTETIANEIRRHGLRGLNIKIAGEFI